MTPFLAGGRSAAAPVSDGSLPVSLIHLVAAPALTGSNGATQAPFWQNRLAPQPAKRVVDGQR